MAGLNDFEYQGNFKTKCKICGEIIDTGIFNVSGHWGSCSGKDVMANITAISEMNNTTEDKLHLINDFFADLYDNK